jgi:hypothetical protein
MTESYLIQWLHAYIAHFGAWVSFALGCTIWKIGVPKLSALKTTFEAILVVALIGALFSSNSQVHYLTHVIQKVNLGPEE